MSQKITPNIHQFLQENKWTMMAQHWFSFWVQWFVEEQCLLLLSPVNCIPNDPGGKRSLVLVHMRWNTCLSNVAFINEHLIKHSIESKVTPGSIYFVSVKYICFKQTKLIFFFQYHFSLSLIVPSFWLLS